MSKLRLVPPALWRKERLPWGPIRGHVYIVQEGEAGAFKVGVATHPVRRLVSLQVGNPRPLHLRRVFLCIGDGAAHAIERHLKITFKEHRLCSEWLDVTLDMLLAVISEFEER